MPWTNASRQRLKKLFLEGFTVMDVAEPLASFDAEKPAEEVRAFMDDRCYDLVGIRRDGVVCGYARRDELGGKGPCGNYLHPFGPDDLVADTDPLQKAIESLSINNQCFVTVLDRVGAIISLSDLEKPPMRMYLFGMITILEMLMTRMIAECFPNGSWRGHLSGGRLEKAEELQRERMRRSQRVDLLDCLQISDKGQLALNIPWYREQLGGVGIASRKAALKGLKEIESLRNNLAHTQEIIPDGWQRIAIFTKRLDLLLEEL
ncbi:MAG: hypothetical protein ED859_11070 [Desulfuromonadales bacterium]|nr:MAG: hypothetical protein ED859_11070 [Desulfuromonadales bacterium]